MLAGSCRGPFVLQQPNRGLGKFPYLLRLPPTNLEYSDSFLGFSMPSTDKGHFLNQQLGSQPGIKEKGFVEEAALREFPNWLLTFMWGGVGHVDTCGHPPPPMHMRIGLRTPAALMLLFEELCIVHCGEEGKCTAVQWGGLFRGHFRWLLMPG